LPDRPLGQHDKKYTVFKKGAVSHLNERVWSLEAMQNECENNRLTSYNLIKELLAFSRKDEFQSRTLEREIFLGRSIWGSNTCVSGDNDRKALVSEIT
jgi:hypothetical protein